MTNDLGYGQWGVFVNTAMNFRVLYKEENFHIGLRRTPIHGFGYLAIFWDSAMA
jgi:hypothetical protein